jgi:predicted adenine nucleotide alpha hydrolase (AANH) superfamily ATPase
VVDDFEVTIFYYNPNIDTAAEFARRAGEIEKLEALGLEFKVVVGEHKPEEYDEAVRGLENLGEGSQRCYRCYVLRLRKTAEFARAQGFDYFSTTLSISPHKKIEWIREIGLELEREFGVAYLDEDFKKRDGYKRSLELSKKLDLYRQDYCGCKYSRAEAELRRATSRT